MKESKMKLIKLSDYGFIIKIKNETHKLTIYTDGFEIASCYYLPVGDRYIIEMPSNGWSYGEDRKIRRTEKNINKIINNAIKLITRRK